jgi:hypothetical protein
MAVKSFSRNDRTGRPVSPLTFRPLVERLEERTVPSTLVTRVPPSPSGIDPLIGGDDSSVILGSSDDGRFVLIQSLATNLIQNQVSPPGQTNLFHLDRVANKITLVSAFDPTGSSKFTAGQKGLGVVPSIPGSSSNAVISADGQSVAFLSSANAFQFDSTLPTGLAVDGGGADLFVWNTNPLPPLNAPRVQLVSKTSQGQAIGGFGLVSNPSISPDGTVATFVSTGNAQRITGGLSRQANTDINLWNDSDVTPDLFRTQLGQTPQPVTYDARVVFDGNTKYFTYDLHQNIRVDPLGRYLTAGGAGFVTLRTNIGGLDVNDAWRYNYSQLAGNASKTGFPVDHRPAVLLPNSFQTPGLNKVGTIDNIIVSSIAAEAMFTYRVLPGAGAAGELVVGYQNNNANDFDLYQVRFAPNAFGLEVELLTAAAGTQNVGGDGVIDRTPGAYNISPDATKAIFTSTATNLVAFLVDKNNTYDIFQRDVTIDQTFTISATFDNPNVTGNGASRFPNQTPDGLAVGFESDANDLTPIPDRNNLTDIYVRDRIREETLLASGPEGGLEAGDGRSFNVVVVRSGQANSDFFRNFEAYFCSFAKNLDPNFTVDGIHSQVYSQKFPIFISQLSRSVSFSGGTNGFVALSRLDNKGNLIIDNKFQPFPGFTGELRVATGDVNNDGVPDVVIGAGPGGGPRVRVIDGFNGRTLDDYFAFEPTFRGGVYVAAADMTGDGRADVIIGAGESGGPRVQIYDSISGILFLDQFAYEATARTGVRVAAGDFNADTFQDLFIAAGVGGGPRVRIFNGANLPGLAILADFFAFENTLRGGAYISAGDYDGDGRADVVAGGGPGGGPRVTIFNAANLSLQDPNVPTKFLDFFAFEPSAFTGGARPILRNINSDKTGDLVVATGSAFPRIRTFLGGTASDDGTPLQLSEITPFNEFIGRWGAWVG